MSLLHTLLTGVETGQSLAFHWFLNSEENEIHYKIDSFYFWWKELFF
jgi:hypothetical protein